MPRVTVRLGALTRSDGRWAQKGVDAAMHAELTELARNRACSDIVLVTGDGDLLPGLMSAKEHGVAVHLWAVQAADGDYNQSEDLVAEADERRVLDRIWITRAVGAKELGGSARPRRRRVRRSPQSSPPRCPIPRSPPRLNAPPGAPMCSTARVRQDPEAPTGRRGSPQPAARGCPPRRTLPVCAAPAPSSPAPPSASATLRWSSDRAGWSGRARPGRRTAGDHFLPTLAQLTSAEQRWADREEDITTVGGDPFEVGQVFARRWIERLPELGHVQKLSTIYPRIPHRIDGELLRYAARSVCWRTRTTRSTSTTAMRSGRDSGGRSMCGRLPSTPPRETRRGWAPGLNRSRRLRWRNPVGWCLVSTGRCVCGARAGEDVPRHARPARVSRHG